MTIRRITPLRPSAGKRIPPELRRDVLARDGWRCVGELLGFPVADHRSALEVDHVRASGALGKKSETAMSNLVSLCGRCHRWKTERGREARPHLLRYLETFAGEDRR